MFKTSGNLLSSGIPDQPFMSVTASMGLTSTQGSRTRAKPEDFARQLGIEEVEPKTYTRSRSQGLPLKFQSVSGLTGPPSHYVVENPLVDPSLQHTAAAQMAELEPTFKVEQFFKVDHSPKTTRDPETLNVQILRKDDKDHATQKDQNLTTPTKRAAPRRTPALSDPNYIEMYRDRLIAPADSLSVKKESMMGTIAHKKPKKRIEEPTTNDEWFKRRPTSTTAHTFMFHANNINKDIREHRREVDYVLTKDPINLHINTFKRGKESILVDNRVDSVTGVATGSLLPTSSYLTSTPITNNLRANLSRISKQGSRISDF